MSSFASNPDALSGIFDWFTGRNPDGPPNAAEQRQIADAVVRIPAMAAQVASLRRQLMAMRSAPVSQGKVVAGLQKLAEAERSLYAFNGMTRLAWQAAYKAGKVSEPAPQEAEVGMSGVFAWVAIGIAGASIIAVFFIAAPAVACIVAITGALSAVAAIVDLLAQDAADARSQRKPGDAPVPALVQSAAGTAAGLSLLPLLAIAGAGLWFMSRRRSR